MPTAREWLEFFYPALFDNMADTYSLPSEVAMALSVGEPWKPTCLTPDQQAQAQAHYAAYVLQYRRLAISAGISASEAAAVVVSGPIVERQEGSTRIRYRESVSGSNATVVAQQATGPGTPYAAWQAMWNACIAGTIDPGSGEVVRRGGIITRYGFSAL